MKCVARWFGCLLAFGFLIACPEAIQAQVRSVLDPTPQAVFGGGERTIRVHFQNSGAEEVSGEVRARLLQLTSATAVPIRVMPWKTLRVLPGQEVVEGFQTEFPTVKAETRFAIQWVDATGRVMGRTDVRVFPGHPLGGLKPLLEGSAVGVVDPANRIAPVLREAGVDVEILATDDLAGFEGRLLICGSTGDKASDPVPSAADLRRLARKGMAVVWLVAPESGKPLKPSFERMPEGDGTMMIANPSLVEELATSPQAQNNLLELANQAMRPVPSARPDSDQNE